jgi:hypothetical protein
MDPDSTDAAERSPEKMWSDFALLRRTPQPAEKRPFLLRFSASRLTGRDGEDCYTFEHFAPSPGVIRSNYYYHYKRRRFVLKEETTWS